MKQPVPNAILIHEGTEKYNIIFKQYPTTYRLADAMTPTYYTEKSKLTKALQKKIKDGEYIWQPKGKNMVKCLFDKNAKEYLIKNIDKVGKPRNVVISGQDFWRGGIAGQWHRIKLKEQLMRYFTVHILQQLPGEIQAPRGNYIQLEYIFYTDISDSLVQKHNKVQDLDNHAYPYMKIFKDTLQSLNIIKGDDPRYVRGGYYQYVHEPNPDERRLEIKFHFCGNGQGITRPIYTYNDETNNPDYHVTSKL